QLESQSSLVLSLWRGLLFRGCAWTVISVLFLRLPAQLEGTGRAGRVSPGAIRRNGGTTRELWTGRVETGWGKCQLLRLPRVVRRLPGWYESSRSMPSVVNFFSSVARFITRQVIRGAGPTVGGTGWQGDTEPGAPPPAH